MLRVTVCPKLHALQSSQLPKILVSLLTHTCSNSCCCLRLLNSIGWYTLTEPRISIQRSILASCDRSLIWSSCQWLIWNRPRNAMVVTSQDKSLWLRINLASTSTEKVRCLKCQHLKAESTPALQKHKMCFGQNHMVHYWVGSGIDTRWPTLSFSFN